MKKFSTYYSLLKTETNTATQEDEQQDSTDEEIQAEIKGFFSTENLDKVTKEDKVLNWWNLNKTKYPHLASFARKYLAAPSSSVYSERLFSEAGNLYEQKRNRLLPKTGEKLLFLHHNLKKQE